MFSNRFENGGGRKAEKKKKKKTIRGIARERVGIKEGARKRHRVRWVGGRRKGGGEEEKDADERSS